MYIVDPKTLRAGSMVKYKYQGEVTTEYVVMNNHRNIWIAKEKNFKPPYTRTIKWEDALEILTPENDPEYFL